MRRSWVLFVAIIAVGTNVMAQGEPPVDQDGGPRWYRGNLHTHSLWSDGNDYPEMIVDWYVRHGYQFLALSDHNTLGQGERWIDAAKARKPAGDEGLARYKKRFGDAWVMTRTVDGVLQVRLKPLGEYRTRFERPGSFLLIQGEEISDHFEKKPIHMNASNLIEAVKPQGGKSVVDTMERNLAAVEEQAKRLGQPIVTHMNHPNFHYAITAEELAMVTRERFFEVYNGHPSVNQLGDETHVGIDRMWDIINTLRIAEMHEAPLYGLGNDDSHNYFGTDGASPGRGWIQVRAPFLTPESIIEGLETGDFYASSGVALEDVQYDPKAATLELKVQAEPGASYTTQFIGTLTGYDRARKPVQDKDGKPLPVTQRYSDDVGKVLATVEGPTARYQLTGEELYVRAVVISSQPPENPVYPDQHAQAWTQPVGWEKVLARPRMPRPTRRKNRKPGTVDVLPQVAPVAHRPRGLRSVPLHSDPFSFLGGRARSSCPGCDAGKIGARGPGPATRRPRGLRSVALRRPIDHSPARPMPS